MTRKRESPALSPAGAIASRVRQLRKDRGWSAERLATEMQKAGIDWQRSVVASLESGRRQNVTVAELLALGYVLDCAPANLLVPWEDDALLQITAELSAPAGQVRGWVRGWPNNKAKGDLPGTDPLRYARNSPPTEDQVLVLTPQEYEILGGNREQR